MNVYVILYHWVDNRSEVESVHVDKAEAERIAAEMNADLRVDDRRRFESYSVEESELVGSA